MTTSPETEVGPPPEIDEDPTTINIIAPDQGPNDAIDSTSAEATALSVARDLINAGIPVFVAKPALDKDGNWNPKGGHNGCGYWLPKEWQKTEPDLHKLDDYRPGKALGMVCGHKVDGLDFDPRNGGDESRTALDVEGTMPRVYGRAATPSGGTHELVAPLGVHSLDNKVLPGLDVKSGAADGKGRGFLFIAPTKKRSKVDGTIGQYRWTEPPDLSALAAEGPQDRSGEKLAELINEKRAKGKPSTNGQAKTPYQFDGDVNEIIAGCLTDGEPSAKVKTRLAEAVLACYGQKRHDDTRDHALALLRYGKQGEPGVNKALTALQEVFTAALCDDRPGGEAEAEKEYLNFFKEVRRACWVSLTLAPMAVVAATVVITAKSSGSHWMTSRMRPRNGGGPTTDMAGCKSPH
jgi:hypothetical protein